MNPTETFTEEQRRHIYINARTFISDEQYYFASFGILFVAISIWALTQHFQPLDTLVVFMVIGIMLIFIPMYWFYQRRGVKRDALNKVIGEEKLYPDEPKDWEAQPQEWKKQNPKTWKDMAFFRFFHGIWYTVMKKHNKPWDEFKKNTVSLPDDSWTKLNNMVTHEAEWNNTFYRAFSYGGALAVLGTILRLHGVNKQSNTSGTILVLLYELVFTLYCTWQLLFNEKEAATTVCLTKITDDNYQRYKNAPQPQVPTYSAYGGPSQLNAYLDVEN